MPRAAPARQTVPRATAAVLAFALIAMFICACVGRPVPKRAPPPTPTAAALIKPTETPVSAPAPSPAPNPAPSPSWETLASLGEMSQIALSAGAVCGLRPEDAEGNNAICVSHNQIEWGGSERFSQIDAGKEFHCALRSDRKIACGGANIYGETDPPEGEFHAISTGKRHACALDAAGKAVCWGWNQNGRADPPTDATFIAIDAGHAHTCGIAEFGNLVCWGADSMGQSEPREGPFAALALGKNHTCALRPSGAAFCQGDDSHGQSSPPEAARFSQISAGDRQTCGIAQDGAIECWGASPVSKPAGDYVSVSVGYSKTCALRADGYAECWDYAAEIDTPEGEPVFLDGEEFDQPVEMFPWPFGGLAIAERKGYIEIRSDAKSHIALDISNRVYCCQSEVGMLSAVPDPDFDNFPFIYVYYQTDVEDRTPNIDSFRGRLSRFLAADGGDGGRIIADEELVILEMSQSGIHMGGALRFGPDGMLYASLGEDADCAAEKRARGDCMSAQDPRTLSGKIIRLDVRGATEAEPYRVPSNNPFADTPNARPEIWASGLRNPYRMSFDREGSLIVADVGQIYFEELSIARAGANLGWPRFEANLCRSQDANLCAEVGGYEMPIHAYDHRNGKCAIIGGASLPGPDGEYVFGDYCAGLVWALEGDAQSGYSAREIADLSRPIAGFGTDADGAIYALTQDGPIIPITP